MTKKSPTDRLIEILKKNGMESTLECVECYPRLKAFGKFLVLAPECLDENAHYEGMCGDYEPHTKKCQEYRKARERVLKLINGSEDAQ
jgi:hypothetical protein